MNALEYKEGQPVLALMSDGNMPTKFNASKATAKDPSKDRMAKIRAEGHSVVAAVRRTVSGSSRSMVHEFKEGDWAVAEMRRHPLKGDRSFYAELTQYITSSMVCWRASRSCGCCCCNR